VGQGLARILGLVITMVMARVLLKEDLAAFRQTFLAYSTVVPLLSLGVGQGMYYFLPTEKARLRGRVTDGIAALGAMGCLFAVFLVLGGNEILARGFANPQVARLLLWMIPFTIISLPATAAESVLVARDRVMLASAFGVGRQILICVATLVPLVFWKNAEAPLIGNVVAATLMGCVAIGLMIRSVPNDSFMPSLAGIKELLFFTVPLALAGMFGALAMQLDKFIVAVLCSPEEFAVYSLGAIEVPLIAVVTSALTAVTLADMRKSVVADNKHEALRLFREVATKSSYVILPIMLFLMITADTFIEYLYSDAYKDSAVPFRIYLTLLPIRTVVFGSLIMAFGRNRFILFRAMIGLALNAVLSTILVWNFGPWGAVVATVTTIYLWDVPANIYVLSQELQNRWYEILPFREYGNVCLALVPLVVISIIIAGTVESIHAEFALIAMCFAAYLAVYWNDRLYSYRDLNAKIASALGRRK
jgi:O-antigen/teichoic acid export membrane protein